MTEKLSADFFSKSCADFDRNFAYIKETVADAAERSGRRAEDITILAATKTVPVEIINYAASKGLKFIGENRVQEFCAKLDLMNKDLHRHFIGHLQTNKVKYIVGNVELIHSVDSVKLAGEISKQSIKNGIITDILLEVNIGREETKSGFFTENLPTALTEIAEFKGVRVKGLMCIPPDEEKFGPVDGYFAQMHKLFIDISAQNMDNNNMQYLSMGMSGDFYKAILNGANIIRVGTALFGERNYSL